MCFLSKTTFWWLRGHRSCHCDLQTLLSFVAPNRHPSHSVLVTSDPIYENVEVAAVRTSRIESKHNLLKQTLDRKLLDLFLRQILLNSTHER